MASEHAVRRALDEVRPALWVDGGDVQLVGIDGTTVKVQLAGACRTCPARESTVLYVIQRAVQERAPAVRSVVAV